MMNATETEEHPVAASLGEGKTEDAALKQSLVFEITSAYINEKDGADKRHVVYTLQVRHIAGKDDTSPATLERRYTDFLNLYNGLRAEQPQLMAAVPFPKKVLIGNFDNKLISTRSTGFESLLKDISIDPRLRCSGSLLGFLQDKEMVKAKELVERKDFSGAMPILENNFRLLNKVYTDRSHAVLFALCRLLGCCVALPGLPNAERWADIALHRYEGVCDSDLLELYIPLLHICIKVWWHSGRNREILETRIKDLRQQGIKMNEDVGLLQAVDMLETRLSKV